MIQATIDETEELPKGADQRPPAPKCPACATFTNPLVRSFLDSRTGKTVRLFCCQCGESRWLD